MRKDQTSKLKIGSALQPLDYEIYSLIIEIKKVNISKFLIHYKNTAHYRRKKRRDFLTSEKIRESDGKGDRSRRKVEFPTEFFPSEKIVDLEAAGF